LASDIPSEFAFIDWVRQQQSSADGVMVGIGDDCAVLNPRPNPTLVTTDMLMEGSCFILDEAGPYRVGRKAMAVNLSDIAAMAGTPRTAFVSLGIPRNMSFETLKELYRGMKSMADEFGVTISGGDTNTWKEPLTISVTLLGEAGPSGAVLRSGAKLGDIVMVTGQFGGSILGHHLDFKPRVRLASWLTAQVALHSMIDVSDGLAKDLHRILEASGVGAELDAEAIPVSLAAHECSKLDGKSPLEHALGDGEDFELIFTVSPEDSAKLGSLTSPEGIPLRAIGKIVESGFWLTDKGNKEALKPMGYEHEFGRPE
jgi:thiamine-monophosphate kinase